MIQGLHILALLSFLIPSVFLGGCLTTPESSESLSSVQVHLTDTEQTAIASNRFALDMYRELANRDGNLFFSPWSLNTALAMTYKGARGKTAEEMRTVLHFCGDESTRRQAYSSIDRKLNANESARQYLHTQIQDRDQMLPERKPDEHGNANCIQGSF